MAWVAAAATFPVCLRPLSSLAVEPAQQERPSDDQSAIMAGIIRKFMDEFRVPGLSMAIARHGQFVYREAFGIADQAKDEKATTSHLFRIASVTKPITAVAIFSLVEKGSLQLGDLIFGHEGVLQFDYGKSYPALVQKITLEHLLTHTGGGWGNDRNDPMMFDQAMETGDLIKWTLQNVPLQNEPGKNYAYSNFGYCILGRVLEKITGQSYADFVCQDVLAKCDVTDMRIASNTLPERLPGEVVYYGQNGDDPYRWNIRRMDSHGGWLGTPSDLVRFAMHVDGFSTTPNILAKKTIEVMTTPSPVFTHYAKGWCVNNEPNWWHGGTLPGTCTILVRTGTGLCWAAFANTHTRGMDEALDRLMWNVVKTVPAWRA
jgi:CubicO group peptidase (beta-lactamase class C family)